MKFELKHIEDNKITSQVLDLNFYHTLRTGGHQNKMHISQLSSILSTCTHIVNELKHHMWFNPANIKNANTHHIFSPMG